MKTNFIGKEITNNRKERKIKITSEVVEKLKKIFMYRKKFKF